MSYRTFRRWMVAGESDEPEFCQFWHAVTRAGARARLEQERRFFAAGAHDWRAAEKWLARRCPEDWAPLRKHEITTRAVTPIRVILDDEDLALDRTSVET